MIDYAITNAVYIFLAVTIADAIYLFIRLRK